MIDKNGELPGVSSLGWGVEFQPYGTVVPSLRDCSSKPTGLEFQAYGTGVPSLRDCSSIPVPDFVSP